MTILIKYEVSLSKEDRELVRKVIMLTDDLKAAVSGLTTSVDNLATRQPAPVPVPVPLGGSVSDADVFQAITDVKTQSARIDTLVNPTPPVVTQSPNSAPAAADAAAAAIPNFENPLT